MNEPFNQKPPRNWPKTILIILALVLLYGLAINSTEINLQEPLEPQRQENLVSLIRELARPDLFAYDTETLSTNASIRMPCPDDIKASQVNNQGRTLVVIPNCVTTTQDVVLVQGTNFPPNASGIIRWYPDGSTTTRRITDFKANNEGAFEVEFTMPDVRESAEPQRLEFAEVVSRQVTGLSDTTLLALDKIVETVLMALMASTVGTLLAIPISFMAARNLMVDIKMPLGAIMLVVVLIPLFGWIGGLIADLLVMIAAILTSNAVLGIISVLIILAITFFVFRLMANAMENTLDSQPAWQTQALLVLFLFLSVFSLVTLAHLGVGVGTWLSENLGVFGFVGNFIFVLSDLTILLLSVLVGFVGILFGITLGGRYGEEIILRLPHLSAQIFTAVATAVGTAVFFIGVTMSFIWINLLGLRDFVPETTAAQLQMLILPALIIGIILGLLSLLAAPKRPFPIGTAIYTLTRGTLNGLRSIEPLMMGFVFTVWVGLGPFAGILALILHSVADLGKLFSEQVENIDDGPREAVTATGANAIQSIVYAVVPQVVPHYIAYIFYRWDINVRMSTIIGFVGGGGIGFVLQRLLNQLLYSQAMVMVIAIAVVVMVLDQVSSRIRSRII